MFSCILQLPSAVDIPDVQLLDLDIEEERFMYAYIMIHTVLYRPYRNAWRVVLSDINKLSEINKQLVDLGKEINKYIYTALSENNILNLFFCCRLPISIKGIKRKVCYWLIFFPFVGDSSVEKSQVDHLRDIFTKEAMQNLRYFN